MGTGHRESSSSKRRKHEDRRFAGNTGRAQVVRGCNCRCHARQGRPAHGPRPCPLAHLPHPSQIAAFDELFSALDRCESILERQRYIAGDRLTEADIRLFHTLIRFDEVYVVSAAAGWAPSGFCVQPAWQHQGQSWDGKAAEPCGTGDPCAV